MSIKNDLATNLLQYGWNYGVVDIQGCEPNAKAHGYRPDAELITDAFARVLPAPTKSLPCINRFSTSISKFFSASPGVELTHLFFQRL